MGASLTLPIGQGRLALGVWQVGEQTHVGVGQTHVGVGQAHVGMGQGAICHVRHPGWAAYTHL